MERVQKPSICEHCGESIHKAYGEYWHTFGPLNHLAIPLGGGKTTLISWISAVHLALSVYYGYGHKCHVWGKFYNGEWHYIVSW